MNEKEIIHFLFIIDNSGSMYGQKMAAVNASVRECLDAIQETVFPERVDIRISIVTFAEKMQLRKMGFRPSELIFQQLKVEPQEDGFYPLTSYCCLYRGIRYIFEKNFNDGQQGKNTHMIVYSDAKPIDREEAEEIRLELSYYVPFVNADRYFVNCGEETDHYNQFAMNFVENNAEKIVRGEDIPQEIRQLITIILSEESGSSMYDGIFG